MAFLKGLQGYIVFGEHVNFTDGQPSEHGAIFDLQGSPTGLDPAGLSGALRDLNNRDGFGVPTHLIAGSMTPANFTSGRSGPALAIPQFVCNTLDLGYSPMADLMTTYPGWQQIFNSTPSDAIVSVASALAGQSLGNNAEVFTGLIHSSGPVQGFDVPLLLITLQINFGLIGPWEIDLPGGSPIPQKVIGLLQTPLSTAGVFQPIPH